MKEQAADLEAAKRSGLEFTGVCHSASESSGRTATPTFHPVALEVKERLLHGMFGQGSTAHYSGPFVDKVCLVGDQDDDDIGAPLIAHFFDPSYRV